MENISAIKNKILFVLFILVIYRFGTYIPIPGVDVSVIKSSFDSGAGSLAMFNIFSGGALERMSIFSLNIMPYVTASIIIQVSTSISKGLHALKKDGTHGNAKINQYTRYLTILLAFFQSIAVYYTLKNMEQSPFVSNSSIFFVTTAVSLIGGTVMLMWFGERITSTGIGNGISIIIFSGIVSQLPATFSQIFNLSKSGMYSWVFVVVFIVAFIGFILLIVFCERIFYKVNVQHSSRGMSSFHANSIQSNTSFMPLKINMSGVIPPIFASSLLMFPSLVVQIFQNNNSSNWVLSLFTRGGVVYILVFAFLIVFFSFFYTSIVFNTDDVSSHLKKNNSFILGIRPGASTAKYLDNILFKLTIIGAIYLTFICILPEIFTSVYSLPIYIGGTGVLIMSSVVMDVIMRIQSMIISNKYSGTTKRRIKVRVR